MASSSGSSRDALVSRLEIIQEELDTIVQELNVLRENRRAIALAITNIQTGRLWLGDAIMSEPKA